MKSIPTTVRIWLRLLLIAIGVMWVGRIVFMMAYPQFYTSLPARELLYAWLTGLRFDVASALITITIPCLLLWVPWFRNWYRKLGIGLAIFSVIVFLTAATFIWSDILYYAEAGHHLTFEVKGIKKDVVTMLQLVVTEYPWQLVGLLLFWFGLGWTVFRQFLPLIVDDKFTMPKRWWSWVITGLTIVSITVLGIRGGFQVKPMRLTFAFRGDNVLAGHLALNGWYTFVTTAFANEGKIVELMPDELAFQRTQAFYQAPGDRFLDPKFPLYRSTSAASPIAAPGEKPNVVLIIVESLTASYLASFDGSPATMPFLDSLAGQSVLLKRCYSIGTRSMEGLSAILASIPNLMGTPFMGSTQEQTKVKGLGTIFNEQGYSTYFIHAAKPGSMNIMQIVNIAGYKKFYHQYDFPKDQFDDHWGVWDRYAFKKMSNDMDTLREPFHYGVFTISTHSPFLLPPEFKPPFPSTMPRAEALNCFANLDVELRRFFAHEAQQPRFKRTIYVIMGDHTSQIRPEGGNEARFRIGALIYAPGRLQPQVIEEPVSQMDVEPTLIHLCGLNTTHASFGRSIFDTTAHNRFAYFTIPGCVMLRNHNRLLINNLEKDLGLFNPGTDFSEKMNLLPTEPAIADSMRQDLYGFYQTAERLLNNNRIIPLIEK